MGYYNDKSKVALILKVVNAQRMCNTHTHTRTHARMHARTHAQIHKTHAHTPFQHQFDLELLLWSLPFPRTRSWQNLVLHQATVKPHLLLSLLVIPDPVIILLHLKYQPNNLVTLQGYHIDTERSIKKYSHSKIFKNLLIYF